MARRKRAKTGQQIADKWSKAMQSPQTKSNYLDGVNGAAVKPQVAAQDQQAMQDYADGCAQSVQNGYRAAQLQKSANTNDWEEGCRDKGAAALASAGTRKAAKAAAAYAKWAPIYQQGSDAAAAVQGPKGDRATIDAKIAANLDVLMAAGKRAGR